MALYRNVAGAGALGFAQDALSAEQYSGGGDPSRVYFTAAPDGGGDGQVYYDPWYAQPVPPTVAPDPLVINPPPDTVYVSPTGAVQSDTQLPAGTTGYLPQLPGTGNVTPIRDQVPVMRLTNTTIPIDGTVNTWGLVALAVTLLAAVGGDDLLGEKKHMALYGGLAAMYFLTNKKQ